MTVHRGLSKCDTHLDDVETRHNPNRLLWLLGRGSQFLCKILHHLQVQTTIFVFGVLLHRDRA